MALKYSVVDGAVRLELWIGGRSQQEIAAVMAGGAQQAAQRKHDLATARDQRRRLRAAVADADKGEHRRGEGQRKSHDFKTKAACVDIADRIYDDLTITNKTEAWKDPGKNPKFCGMPFSNLIRWMKPEERRTVAKALAKNHAGTLLRAGDAESRRTGKYAAMERTLFASFKAKRARGRLVSGRWLTHMARNILKIQDPDAAPHFKGSEHWRRRFRKRWNISIRKKTNCKNQSWEETKPVLQRYLRGLRRRVTLSEEELASYKDADGVVPPLRLKYGRYLPWERFNVDQVPLPFVNGMGATYEMKGATRVAINQLGPALSKRQATGQICFRPEVPPLLRTHAPSRSLHPPPALPVL